MCVYIIINYIMHDFILVKLLYSFVYACMYTYMISYRDCIEWEKKQGRKWDDGDPDHII